MMAERFAREYVGEMNFNKRDADCGNGVAQGDAGVGESRRVDHNEIDAIAALS